MDLVQLNADIAREFPDFKVVRKSDSFWMKVIDVLLRIITLNQMNEYMTEFTTTIGYTVFVPSAWDQYIPRTKVSLLRHERVHMRQTARMGRLVFSFKYLFWPLPMFYAKARAELEMEAYEETIRSASESGVDVTRTVFRDDIIKHFTTGEYGWMYPFKKKVGAWYDDTVLKVLTGK